MIRNIFNWVGGGFFRTIGRFVAFIVLGAIAYILIGKSNIKITDLLGIETVKASTVYTPSWINNCSYRLETGNTWYVCSYSNSVRYVNTSVNGKANYYLSFGNAATEISIPSGSSSFKFNLYLKDLSLSESEISGSTYCQPQTTTSAGTFYRCYYGDSTQDVTITSPNYTDIALQVKYYFNNDNPGGYSLPCYAEQSNNDYIVYSCPLRQDLTHVDGIIVGLETYKDITLNIGYQYFINFESDSTSNAINNQTNQQQQQHNETMSYIQDTNMTETNSTATSFFDNFSDTDHGGLSSIITAPISTINSMLSNTCVAPSATWKGATITLPCGDMLWSRPGAQDLKNLLNVFYGGFICYYAIRRLFLLIENLKDPTKDNLEVTDL